MNVCSVVTSLNLVDGEYPRCGAPAVKRLPVLDMPICEGHAVIFELSKEDRDGLSG